MCLVIIAEKSQRLITLLPLLTVGKQCFVDIPLDISKRLLGQAPNPKLAFHRPIEHADGVAFSLIRELFFIFAKKTVSISHQVWYN